MRFIDMPTIGAHPYGPSIVQKHEDDKQFYNPQLPKASNDKVPNAHAQQFADMVEDVATLTSEAGRESPRKKQYQLSLEGIKEAAVTLGEIAKPVLAVAEKLAPLLGVL